MRYATNFVIFTKLIVITTMILSSNFVCGKDNTRPDEVLLNQQCVCDTSEVLVYFSDSDGVTFHCQPSLEFIEEKELTTLEINGEKRTQPFGLLYTYWETLKSLYIDGDCVVFFKTSDRSWKFMYGIKGYILIRDGKPIYTIITGRS